MSVFNEDSRVKIPAIIHLTRLGYNYMSIKGERDNIDSETNIFINVFSESIRRINSKETLSDKEIENILTIIKEKLSNDDLGKSFFTLLQNGINGIKIIDLENFRNNDFKVVTELPYENGEDVFRPDIITLINGIPLAFIEVKKPNNKEGILAEQNRIHARFRNKKFRRFINITQLLVFSNNQEYDELDVEPIQGAFYATPSNDKVIFNRFREEDKNINNHLVEINSENENFILKDNNLVSIKSTEEYKINRNENTPTNRLLTSLFLKERLMFILKYGIVYVTKTNQQGISQIQKHIMRYPQLFATFAIEKKLNEGADKGIIWHTQGSGKTALAYFNFRYLRDYYQKQGKIAKFYFIVDRISLLKQTADEFRSRGLKVETIKDRDEFKRKIARITDDNAQGEDSVTVVNIQKFQDDATVKLPAYNVNVQRVFFIDEAHRSYNPKGSFLANLYNSDRNAIKIALTGTPLICEMNPDGTPKRRDSFDSKKVFGDYIHKYYYNKSIIDGYTLRLIREEIETTYKIKLQAALEQIKALEGSLTKEDVYAHPKFVKELVTYIVDDFKNSRVRLNDDSIGAMIVCDSSAQAREIFNALNQYEDVTKALILHDEDDNETREEERKAFTRGEIDIIVVYNMLLTGFDAPRLKKQYLGRIIKAHNLLQTLTRVNRPYKNFRYGYVVDFANIKDEFDKTNKAYFNELQKELGDEYENYSNLFKDKEEIEKDIAEIKNKLFLYDTSNMENFSSQVSAIEDKNKLLELRKAIDTYKALYNLIKLMGYYDLIKKLDLNNIYTMSNEVQRRIDIINLKERVKNSEDISGILNIALDQIDFQFRKVKQEELIIADKFREALERARLELGNNLDPKDKEFVTLLEELKRVFKKKNIEELTSDEMELEINELDKIRSRAKALNQRDEMLCAKYGNDVKYLRTHKRMMETPPPISNDIGVYNILTNVKKNVDEAVVNNEQVLNNEAYFIDGLRRIIINSCKTNGVDYTAQQIKTIATLISNEYFTERSLMAC